MPCKYYKWNGGWFDGDYWCTVDNKRVPEADYKNFCSDYNYDSCPTYRQLHGGSGCFLTTIVHRILCKEDNDKILENFRFFRDNVLQQNEKYYEILKEYDVIGPMLVDCIVNDCDKEKMANGVYRNILLPLNDKISNKEYDHAVNMYHCMTISLISYYGLDNEYEEIRSNGYNYPSFNPKTAGHGLRKVRVNTDCCIKCQD